jgi:hypothetical protein
MQVPSLPGYNGAGDFDLSQSTKTLKFQRGFESERSSFEELAPKLRERYDEVFVAVHRGEVVDSDADFQALVGRFFERYGDAPVYFGYVGQRKPILRVSSPSVQP